MALSWGTDAVFATGNARLWAVRRTMGILTITGPAGCRATEVARLTAAALSFECVDDVLLAGWMKEEFAAAVDAPARAWPAMAASVIARVAVEHHLVLAFDGAEFLFERLAGVLRVGVQASGARRIGNVMLDERLDRPSAKAHLQQADAAALETRKTRFGRVRGKSGLYDVVLKADQLDAQAMAAIIRTGAEARGLREQGLVTAAAEAQVQFQLRLQLARHGITPAGKVNLRKRSFGHPSEQVFANLLDFYRIQWEYEPRSFPLQWDKDGQVLEAFTPDFYLPEFDLYIELTTMKQALVTRKNRKVKLLKAIYPHINIQVFYQRDFQDLVMKYGLASA
ncbi:MAG: hypothetical protein ABI823_06170 [Bryobacteraceae bacterium]